MNTERDKQMLQYDKLARTNLNVEC